MRWPRPPLGRYPNVCASRTNKPARLKAYLDNLNSEIDLAIEANAAFKSVPLLAI